MYPNYPNQPGYPPTQPPYGGGGFGMPQPGGIGFDAGQPSYPSYGGAPGGGGFPMPGGGPSYPGGGAPGYPGSGAPSYPGGGAPSYPGAGAPGYPGGGAPSYPGAGAPSYPGGGYPAGGGYPSQPGYPGAGGGAYPPTTGGYPNSSVNNYLPDHIANNPNFQPQAYPSVPSYPGNGMPPVGIPTVCPPGPMTHYQSRPPKNPVLRPYQPFNPNEDAQRLYKAMKGFGTDETTLIDILCRRTSSQRQEIAVAYKASVGKDLLKNLESELRGNVEMLFRALMMLPAYLEAYDLNEAIQGFGTKEATVIDIICTKETNQEMHALKNAYRHMFHKEMESDLRGDVSGYFQRFLVSLMAANRSEAGADYGRAAQQARELLQAGEKQMGTNEVTFNRIFATESWAQLCAIFEEYRKLTGHDIEKAIKSEMSGDVERAFLAVAQVARNPAGYFAQRIQDTMAGAGTHDRALIRNVVLRSEIDMFDVKAEFQRRYGKTLESYIRSDCAGDYKRGLLCLVGDLNWR